LCGAALVAGARFCHKCGISLEAQAPDPRFSSPASYTPKHLADRILTSKAALEGERKHVTVLFADVKGSMELAEQVDAEAWHTILDRFFEILTEGVHRFEGTVNQYTGDGIMALFGGLPSRTRITPSGPAMRRSICGSDSAGTRTSFVSRTGSMSACAWA
jgi:class 3 adenylate cyclase